MRALGLRLFRHTVGGLIVRTTSSVVAVGPMERAFASTALGMSIDQIPIIPLGADCELFRPAQAGERSASRMELGVPQGSFCVAHVGRLVPGKGIPELASVMTKLRDCDPTVLLVGQLDRGVAEQLDPSVVRIVHRPAVPKPTLARYIAAADAGAWLGHPSISAIEVMAAGLPVVASRIPQFVSLLGTDALLVDSQARALELLAQLAQNQTMRHLHGGRNREIALAHHSWAMIADAFLSLCS